ncbi:OadG family protein [Granulicatella seriolae]|uniref:OadG family protein n=1 Tax=Granulicatella seriolae TaxID=2967226 RepID=A0ABT1WQK1_9LACT|nr:OadG family protein [Granulicatella seriolae]
MNQTMIDAFQVTIVAMVLVFFVLFCLMLLMQGVAKIIGNKQETQTVKPAVTQAITQSTSAPNNDLARVAVLTALAHAANEESGKHYQVVDVKRLA